MVCAAAAGRQPRRLTVRIASLAKRVESPPRRHIRMKAPYIAAVAVAAASLMAAPGASGAPAFAQPSSLSGLWDATVIANDVEVPFRFEIVSTGQTAEGFFFEGDRKVASTSGSYVGEVLTLEYDHLNTTLQLKLQQDQLVGTYQ